MKPQYTNACLLFLSIYKTKYPPGKQENYVSKHLSQNI